MPANQQPEQRSLRTVRTPGRAQPDERTLQDPGRRAPAAPPDLRKRHDLRLEARLKDVFDPAAAEHAEMIFDWGEMSLGNDLLGHQIRTLTHWAEDHPSALVIIRSMLSWNELQNEIRDERLPSLPNIVVDDGRMQIPVW